MTSAKILKFALTNLFRNAWLSLVTTTILVIALLAANLLIGINYLKERALISVENLVDLTVSLDRQITPDEVTQIVTELDTLPQVANIEVRTPDQNLEDFRQRNPDLNADILPSLDTNPLSYSLRIKTFEVSQYGEVIAYLKASAFKSQIDAAGIYDTQTVTDSINNFITNFNLTVMVILAIFVIIGLIVIFNTIRVSIFTHREEVGIMKLVGATNWFVRGPFLLESVIYSLVATAVAWLIVYPLLIISRTAVASFFTGIDVDLLKYFSQNFWLFFSLEFVGLSLLNLLATSLALRRYLKV